MSAVAANHNEIHAFCLSRTVNFRFRPTETQVLARSGNTDAHLVLRGGSAGPGKG